MRVRPFGVVLFVALCAAIGWSQVATGNLRGTISDATGGLLPNCSVTITHMSTGLVRKVLRTNRATSTLHRFPSASTASRRTRRISDQGIHRPRAASRPDRDLPIGLNPGAVTDGIEVTAAPPVLETQVFARPGDREQAIRGPAVKWAEPVSLGVLSGGAVAFQGLTTNLPILAGGGRYNCQRHSAGWR